MTQSNARAHVDGSSEAGDAQGFAPQLFHSFNFRAGHQILYECIECVTHDHTSAPPNAALAVVPPDICKNCTSPAIKAFIPSTPVGVAMTSTSKPCLL